VSGSRIDRAKHDVDILEHVLKGVHAEEPRGESDSAVLDVRIRQWPGGHGLSAVQVQVLDPEPDDTE
jgi:hypothetical protein